MKIRPKKNKNVVLTFDPNDNVNYLKVIWHRLKFLFTVLKNKNKKIKVLNDY